MTGTITVSSGYELEKVLRLAGEYFLGWSRPEDDKKLELSSVTFYSDYNDMEGKIRFPITMSPRALATMIDNHCEVHRYGSSELPQFYTLTIAGRTITGITPTYREVK